MTFLEPLKEEGISWRVYQNELSIDTGLRGEAKAWLANLTDNPELKATRAAAIRRSG